MPVAVHIALNPHKAFPDGLSVDSGTPVCDPGGLKIPGCPDAGSVGRNVMNSALEHLKRIGVTPPPTDPFEVDWTLDLSDTPAVMLDGQIIPIEKVRITGTVKWSSKVVNPQFKILRRFEDKTPCNGCIVGLTSAGDLLALSFAPDMTARIAFVPLADRLLKGKIYRKSYLPHTA